MAITPEQVLERIRNNQHDHDAVFESVYKLPNGNANDYCDPYGPDCHAVLSRDRAMGYFDMLLANVPGHPMTEQQAHVVQMYRPIYNTQRQGRKWNLLATLAAGVGFAAALWGSFAMDNIKGNENFVKERYQQYQKSDRSVKLEDVTNEAQQETTRGRNIFVYGGALTCLAGVGYLLWRKIPQNQNNQQQQPVAAAPPNPRTPVAPAAPAAPVAPAPVAPAAPAAPVAPAPVAPAAPAGPIMDPTMAVLFQMAQAGDPTAIKILNKLSNP